MELRDLRCFVAVAEEAHFGRAAARLGIAQPPLSRKIQAIEAELGFLLFERSRRHVRLTAAGAALLQHTPRVFEAVDVAVHEARRASRGELGRLVVAYAPTFAYSGLPELIRAFRAKSPRVDVVLHEMLNADQVDSLRSGRVDVGFIRGPIDDPALQTELVRRELLVVTLPSGHPLAARKVVPIGALAKEPWVVFPRERGPAYFDGLMRLCHDAGFVPRISQEAAQLDVLSLVAAGLGVSLMPSSIRSLRRRGVVFRPLAGRPRSDLLAAWSKDRAGPIVRDFLAVMRRVRDSTSSR